MVFLFSIYEELRSTTTVSDVLGLFIFLIYGVYNTETTNCKLEKAPTFSPQFPPSCQPLSLQPPSHAAVRSRVIPPLGFHPLSVLPQKPSPTSNSVSAAHQSRPFAWKPLSTGDPNPRPSSPGPPLRPTAPVIDRQTGRKLQRRRRGSAELPSGWVEEFPADTAPRLRSTGEAFNSIVERTALFLLTGGDGGCGGGGTRKCCRWV
uniref:uncharacterized protein LOC132685813 n=1 Tax=Panthera onca TaxID=9690 RepID=UPI0029552069|nr:uncharacterized protein LOC132685813 [Panthera onca]